MKKKLIAGKATVAGKEYDLILHEAKKSKKPVAKAVKALKPSFATTFHKLYPLLVKVKKTDKPRVALRRPGRYPRWCIKSITFEGSAHHLVQLGMLMLLEGNHKPLTRAELFAGVEEVVAESGLQMKKFDDKNFDNSMKPLLASKHVTFANERYTLAHYPNFRTLAVVID